MKEVMEMNITSLRTQLAGGKPAGYLKAWPRELNSGIPRTTLSTAESGT